MSKSFTVDQRQARKLAKDLVALQKTGLPYAVRNSLNACAFEARKVWGDELRAKMILRNKWTVGSLRVEKATGTMIESMESRVGSLVDYMKTQEFGGTETATGKHGVPIPTTSAAGQSMKATVRTKQVQRKNWLSAIHLAGKATGTRQRQNAIAISMAAKSNGVAFLDLGRRKGLFRIARTGKGRVRVRMIWDMSRKSVRLHPRPTLEPTIKVVEQRAPRFQIAALQQQIDRHLLGKAGRQGLVGFF